jgi:glyoxylase-like metal-dependent hydrolase (beta-lactamase superfamily II)
MAHNAFAFRSRTARSGLNLTPAYLPHRRREHHLARLFLLLLSVTGLPGSAVAQGELWLSYLGTAGWEITDGKAVILVDPYLSCLKTQTPEDPVLPDDPRPTLTLHDIAVSDQGAIDAHIKRADFILVTHTHFDHVLDVPYIARKTGAMVIGTESTSERRARRSASHGEGR